MRDFDFQSFVGVIKSITIYESRMYTSISKDLSRYCSLICKDELQRRHDILGRARK